MPTVELLRPRSLTTQGVIFRQNEPRDDISSEIAIALLEDNRFKVTGLSKEDFENASNKPRGSDELREEILDAIDQLDPDDEDAFTATGKPHHLALSRILGYDITAADRDDAMRGRSSGTLDTAEGETEQSTGQTSPEAQKSRGSGVRIVRGAAARQKRKDAQLKKINQVGGEKPAEQEKEPETEEADKTGAPDQDDSTEEAVEV